MRKEGNTLWNILNIEVLPCLRAVSHLSYADVILPGTIRVINLDHYGEDRMRSGRFFFHGRRPYRPHLLTVLHKAVCALLITDDRLRQVLHDTKPRVCTEQL